MDRKLFVALVGAVSLAVAGCGGSGTLTQEQLVRKANAICKHRAVLVARAMAGAKDVRVADRKAIPAVSVSVAALAALKPPASMKASYERLVAYERAILANGRRAAAGRRVQELGMGHERIRLIRELRLTDCE